MMIPSEAFSDWLQVMYQSMCKFWWGEGSGEENGFHIWPRIEDIEVVKG